MKLSVGHHGDTDVESRLMHTAGMGGRMRGWEVWRG